MMISIAERLAVTPGALSVALVHPGAMTDAEVTFAELLAERVNQARAQQAALLNAIDDMRSARSLTFADDEHDPEGSTLSLDQARDAALLNRIEQTLAELSAAGQRLAAGTYGRCESCRREIPRERLLARPEVRLCVPCSTRAAVRRRS